MPSENLEQQDESPSQEFDLAYRTRISRSVAVAGWGALIASIVFLCGTMWLAQGEAHALGNWGPAILLMISRTFGIASFLLGAALVFLGNWTSGSVLFILSIALPVLSLKVLGTF
ncbi:MAG: hypothetical protein KDD64_10045 [Bdellovibrionales bacterium]|nr:hypothetical protein [Bdellovibrionales bacterium]